MPQTTRIISNEVPRVGKESRLLSTRDLRGSYDWIYLHEVSKYLALTYTAVPNAPLMNLLPSSREFAPQKKTLMGAARRVATSPNLIAVNKGDQRRTRERGLQQGIVRSGSGTRNTSCETDLGLNAKIPTARDPGSAARCGICSNVIQRRGHIHQTRQKPMNPSSCGCG